MKTILFYGFFILGLITLANANPQKNVDECLVVAQIFDECVNSEELKTCESRGIALAYALRQAGVDEPTIKNMVKMCVYYCKVPDAWKKDLFIEKCYSRR